MSFLLDTNTCSAHIARPARLAHRFIQHVGRLYVPTVVLGELYVWAYQRRNPAKLLKAIENDLLIDVELLPFEKESAEVFGRVRGSLLKQGITVSSIDMQIAAVALVQDHTLVTHNTSDFQHIPGLRLDDWLLP